jgi:hypothetical protein
MNRFSLRDERHYWQCRYGILTGRICAHSGWVRCGRWGVCWQDRSVYRAPFSERYGYRRVWRIGPWAVRLLKP